MSQWTIPLDKLAEKMKADLHDVARKATADLFRAVVLRSPVGNPALWKRPVRGYVGGRFRANWNVSYGEPDYVTTQSKAEGRGFEEAQRAITLPVGGVVFLSNGLPYSYRLEYEGWSKQATAGMVRVSATEFSDYVHKAISA